MHPAPNTIPAKMYQRAFARSIRMPREARVLAIDAAVVPGVSESQVFGDGKTRMDAK